MRATADRKTLGNILGNPRAEADGAMLDRAFVETTDFGALANTNDFHVIVGRRGTGKSALFRRLQSFFEGTEHTFLHTEVPAEHHALSALGRLAGITSDYKIARAVSRLLWRGYVLRIIAEKLRNHYRLRATDEHSNLNRLLARKRPEGGVYAFFVDALSSCDGVEATEVPGHIAAQLGIESLQDVVRESLRQVKSRVVVMFDGLDEGWTPEPLPTAMLGALALAAADLSDAATGIHVMAFVRDNMFRALGKLEPDFSSHVEGSALRLHWDKNALFHLVTQRVRIALDLHVEKDSKVWDRFAQRDLQGREGFERCLQHTLYRPRDALVLLNRTYQIAQKDQRTEIIGEDLEGAARAISEERLEDLFKEYNVVLPGLRLFADLFRGGTSLATYEKTVGKLQSALEEESFAGIEARDFAILGSGAEIFRALYSVGFLGIQTVNAGPFSFCHDGAPSELNFLPPTTPVAVHPCYWRALDIAPDDATIEVLTEAFDEYGAHGSGEVADMRMKRLGRIVEELNHIDVGAADSRKFEDWVLRAVQILFSGDLANIVLHPDPGGLQRRDVVATNSAKDSFWKRIMEDYQSRHILFEVKNYAELKTDDYRQVLDYSGGPYGKFAVIVYRTGSEGADDGERQRLKEMYLKHGILIFLLPATVLSRCLSKQRSKQRDEYWQKHFSKRLDTHERVYVQIQAVKKRRRRST